MNPISLLEFISSSWDNFHVNINVSGMHAFKSCLCNKPVTDPTISLETALVFHDIAKRDGTGLVIQNSELPQVFKEDLPALFLIPATGFPKHYIVKFYPGKRLAS